MKRNTWIVLALSLFSLSFSYGYPEMARHGYVSCTTCHRAPGGGGILTPYGRSLSGELMSTWTSEKETGTFHGLVKTPDWIQFGGQSRFLQMFTENRLQRTGRFIFMQADLEMALTAGKWSAVGTFGAAEGNAGEAFIDTLNSRRHFIQYQASDEITVRAGKFFPTIGLMTADHATSIRRGLGWDQEGETYNLEGSFLKDNLEVFVTASLGRPNATDPEFGVGIRPSLFLGDRHKVGLNYWYGRNNARYRHLIGTYGILGFSKNFFVLAEADLQSASNTQEWGLYTYLRANYEVMKGLHFYVLHDMTKSDLSNTSTFSDGYGLGVQFFPRPHFELRTEYQRTRRLSVDVDYGDLLWVMFHYYL